eukprot:554234-Prymnesium_polylepis.1
MDQLRSAPDAQTTCASATSNSRQPRHAGRGGGLKRLADIKTNSSSPTWASTLLATRERMGR